MKKLRVKRAMRFTANDQNGLYQVKIIEEVEMADRIDGETLFNFPDVTDAV